jgi:NAD(P)-dependent dehydrogenase (short-subunit alcohol dehydrogenase family)
LEIMPVFGLWARDRPKPDC